MNLSPTLAFTAIFLLLACGEAVSKKLPAPIPGRTDRAKPGDGNNRQTEKEKEQIAAIQWAVNQTSAPIHDCYGIEMARQHRVKGQVTLLVALGKDGSVANASVKKNTTGRKRMADCMIAVWKSFKFPPVFDSGDKIQLPPVSFDGADQYVVSVRHAKAASETPGVIGLISPSNTDTSDGLVSIVTAKKNNRSVRASSETFLYVLSGSGKLFGVKGKPIALRPGVGVFLTAKTPYRYQQQGATPLVWAKAFASSPPNARNPSVNVSRARRDKTTPVPKGAVTAKTKERIIAGGKGSVRMLFETKAAYMGTVTFANDVRIPKHKHEGSSEYLYLLEGQGELYIGDTAYSVSGGDGIAIPRGTIHAFVGSSSKPIKAIQWYFPAGPEQRFKMSHIK